MRPRAKVTIDILQEVVGLHKKSIVTKMNDLMTFVYTCRSFKVMSTIAASISPKLLELETSNLVHGFVGRMLSGRTNNFP